MSLLIRHDGAACEGAGTVLRVLIVEDSPEIQRRLIDLLKPSADVEVIGCAQDVAEAVALADERVPDVVVLDVGLRDGDRGYAVLRHVTRSHPGTQVIVLSNFTWSAMREGFLQGGARAYFDKAFEFRKARDWIFEQAARKSQQEEDASRRG